MGVAGCGREPARPSNDPTRTPTDSAAGVAEGESASASPDSPSPASASTPPPGPVTLTIDGRPFTFPPVRARLAGQGKALTIHLTTAPGGAEDGGSAGTRNDSAAANEPPNGLHLEMEVEVENAGQVDGAQWHYSTDELDRADSLNGLDVGPLQLQPFDVTLTFASAGASAGAAGGQGGAAPRVLTATIRGRFALFEGADRATASRIVPVEGTIRARVEE